MAARHSVSDREARQFRHEHGVQTLGAEPACFVNSFDHAYDYDDPDEWRLPFDTEEIPYRFR